MRSGHRPGWLTTAVLALTLVACVADELLGPNAPQGIEGIVLLGPQCPVQADDDPCPDLPYQAWIRVRKPGGDQVTRIRSGEDGRFRVGLRPGRYTLDPEPGDPFPVAADQDVVVVAGLFTEVTVSYDTGIR